MSWCHIALQRNSELCATHACRSQSGQPQPSINVDITKTRIFFALLYRHSPPTATEYQKQQLAMLQAAVGSLSKKHHDTGVNLVPHSAKRVGAFVSCFRKSRGVLERPGSRSGPPEKVKGRAHLQI
jgi:hypothetical protein